jgi:hypothetical protein
MSMDGMASFSAPTVDMNFGKVVDVMTSSVPTVETNSGKVAGSGIGLQPPSTSPWIGRE